MAGLEGSAGGAPDKWFLKHVNIEFSYFPAISLLGICIYPKELKRGTQIYPCTLMCTAAVIIHNTQRVETTQASTNRKMDKQNVAWTYDKILFSHNEVLIHAST